jgi:hypothetical protein
MAVAAGSTCAVSWTSVTTRRPVSAFTSARISSPRSSPGPRGEAAELRLALSNEDL